MEQILQMMAALPHNCHYCDYRHSYCGKTDEELLKTYETGQCDGFVLGKCYFCAIQQCGDEETQRYLCDEAFYPEGCVNFKPGLGYADTSEDQVSTEQVHRQARTRDERRRRTNRKKKHWKQLASYSWWCSGAYETTDYKGRPFIKRYWRGQRSKWIKKKCNKRFRRTQEVSRQRGVYRKYSEFWWDYD